MKKKIIITITLANNEEGKKTLDSTRRCIPCFRLFLLPFIFSRFNSLPPPFGPSKRKLVAPLK